MYNGAEVGYVIIWVCLGTGYLVMAFILAEMAAQYVGRKAFWTIAFLVLPGISYALFFFQLFYIIRKRKEIKIQQKLIYDKPRPQVDPGGLVHDDEKGISVTPFDNPVDPQNLVDAGSGIGSATPFNIPIKQQKAIPPTDSIIATWKDSRIEELMDWREWAKAWELARAKLKLAQNSSDQKSIEVYKTYLGIIEPNLNSIRQNDDPDYDPFAIG